MITSFVLPVFPSVSLSTAAAASLSPLSTTLLFPRAPVRRLRLAAAVAESSSAGEEEATGSTNGSLPGLPPVEEEDDEFCPVDCVTEFKTNDEFVRHLERAKATGALVVVDFFRPSCGSCKYIERGFMRLCKGSGDDGAPVVFLKHNVIDEYDEQSEVAERLRIKIVPLFHFYKDGELVESFATRDKERIISAIRKYTSIEPELGPTISVETQRGPWPCRYTAEMRGVGGPLLTIGDLLSDLAVDGGDDPLASGGDVSVPSSPLAAQPAVEANPADLSRLFEEHYNNLMKALQENDPSWPSLMLKLCTALKTADKLVSSANTNAEQLLEKVKSLETVLERGDHAVADIVEGLQSSGLAKDHRTSQSKSARK
ncbi:hypothetical protein EJB05_21182 [Eragrostis curvula]|uniref:Thioredoxin domain-containing protein n=1 Tax=Eragrostis curvula TaxID=38414 RepID=A0A5J9V2B1_9POAL|nr:hypothetical protein EJB05_21182 [Eragrostis curvula]